MGAISDFNPQGFSAIHQEVRTLLGGATAALEQGLVGLPDQVLLDAAAKRLTSAGGALRMVGLDGPARIAAEIAKLVSALGERTMASSMLGAGACKRACAEFTEFLDEMIKGKSPVLLRLFQAFREVRLAHGAEAVCESELFYPRLDVELPAMAVLGPGAPETGAAPRTQFQKGLLRWLRERDREGLCTMREAVIAFERQQLDPPVRRFWTAAAAFLDAATEEGLSREVRVTQLMPRIDMQMKRNEQGLQDIDDALMREMLYFVAVSQPVTERLKVVQSAFDLDSYLPSLGEAQQRELSEAFIPEILARIVETKNAWNGCHGANRDAMAHFGHASRRLAQLARRAGHVPMASMLEAFKDLSDALAKGELEHTQSLSLYVATLLVWLEQAVQSGAWCDTGFTSAMQVFARDVRMLGDGTEPVLDFNRVQEHHAQGRADLACVAEAVNATLQALKQGVEDFVRDTSQRAPLEVLAPTFSQLAGVFTLLEFDSAAELVTTARDIAGRLAATADSHQIEPLVDAISSARFFFEVVQTDPVRAEQIVRDALRRLGVTIDDAVITLAGVSAPALQAAARIRAAAVSDDPSHSVTRASLTFTHLPAPQVAAAPPAPASSQREALDPELLEVFLEEATEVLAALDGNLKRLAANGGDEGVLTAVRRGFHTLKGSGRMVGLGELGELAWAVEETMNKWLERKQPANEDLIRLASATMARFQKWVIDLKAGAAVSFEAGEILALAGRLRGDGPGSDAQSEVKVGEVTLGSTLYHIFLSEAEGRVQDLKRQIEALGSQPALALRVDVMRSAHTLAGISQNTGFTPIADLAHAVERWAHSDSDGSSAIPAEDLLAVAGAAAALQRMVQEIRELRAPQAAPAQVEAVEALIARGSAEPGTPAAAVQSAAATDAEAAGGGNERRRMQDDYDSDLLPVFLEEAEDIYSEMTDAVRTWRGAPADEQTEDRLKRALHTMKGSSRMAGGLRLGELVHKIESMVEAATDKTPAFFDRLEEMLDRVGSSLEMLRGGLGSEEAPLRNETGEQTLSPTTSGRIHEATLTTSIADVSADVPAAGADDGAASARTEDAPAQKQQFLKVGVDSVSQLGDDAAEISTARTRLEGQLASSRLSLGDLADNVERLRKQVREMEIQAESQIQSRLVQIQESAEGFDPLELDRYTRIQELTRFISECAHDVAAIQQNLLEKADETESILRQQGRLNRDLQDGLAKLRIVPLATVADRLHRTVRQAARTLGRKARLEIEGGKVELDRALLERLTAPFEHLLRNAVAHGVQDPEARARAGKPETGEIVISASVASNQLKVVVRDDGAGLDVEQVRAKAIERGLLDPQAQVSEEDVMHLIFSPGFSTAASVSEVAGRGVGLDVVKTEIAALGGSVEVHSVPSQGVSFELRLPLTRAAIKAVLVKSGERLYATASAAIEQVLRLEPEQMEAVRREGACHWAGNRYPFADLRDLFADGRREETQLPGMVMLARSGHDRAAFEVDDLVGNREIAVKQLGPQFARLPWVVGGSVLGDGELVLVVDPLQIARGGQRAVVAPVAKEQQRTRTVLVVDDSLTVRKITDRVLSRQGYRVVTAKDGVEALELLQGNILPDLALVDIEMPRMDGFELTKRLRASSRTAALPIIMITSRSADKHRNHAYQIGVNAYLGKPYEVDQLLAEMAGLLGTAADLPKAA